MHPSKVTHKGQITIPAELRKEMNISEGDRVEFKKVGNQIMITHLKKNSLMGLFGLLPRPKRALTIEEINDAIEQGHS